MNGGFQLLEPLIHLVQSFLTAKETAQTAILSKSWYSAWSTRPNIDLDIYGFYFKVHDEDSDSKFYAFMEFSKKTIQRYEQSNLKIESFRIVTTALHSDRNTYEDFVNGMIKRALKIGATHISTQQDDSPPIVILTNEVFEAENLKGLSVEGCQIKDLELVQKVRCSKLESLSLDYVQINSEMISDIALCCPLIKKLSVGNISSFIDYYEYDGNDVYNYLFLSDLSSKFPSLKDLTLTLRGCNAQAVSSRTLERLTFAASGQTGLSVKFDVPSIRKFIFEGDDIFPSLSFVSVLREWESDVSFTNVFSVSTSWFRKLSKLLIVLSVSKIHLSLDIDSDTIFDYDVGHIHGLTKPEVENLTISMMGLQDFSCYVLFDGLFRICRPKVITQNLCSEPIFRGENTNNDLLCRTLVRGLDKNSMYGLRDLEEVNVQLFDEDVRSWCPRTLESILDALKSANRWKSFLDALVSPNGKREIRFKLKWNTQNSSEE